MRQLHISISIIASGELASQSPGIRIKYSAWISYETNHFNRVLHSYSGSQVLFFDEGKPLSRIVRRVNVPGSYNLYIFLSPLIGNNCPILRREFRATSPVLAHRPCSRPTRRQTLLGKNARCAGGELMSLSIKQGLQSF